MRISVTDGAEYLFGFFMELGKDPTLDDTELIPVIQERDYVWEEEPV